MINPTPNTVGTAILIILTLLGLSILTASSLPFILLYLLVC